MDAQLLYNDTCMACARHITRAYSTSFSKGIACLSRRYHAPVYALYGFVRFADEIVDTFHEQDKVAQLRRFRADTFEALESQFSTNPVLQAFQLTVHRYNIPTEYIDAFLYSMEMDLSHKTFSKEEYDRYIYGSAEVVGLMCLCVFFEGDLKTMEPFVAPARALGSAFQKVNFLRDIKSDWEERGRVYFPGVDYTLFNDADKQRIEAEIADEFAQAAQGIARLPASARLGVLLAFRYYLRLFGKIRRLPARAVTDARIRVSNWRKMSILLSTYWQFKLGVR